jgi:predicted amidohydrolase YtcJ
MTHEYTILTGGVVLPGGAAPPCSAIAWTADTILALGSDEAVLSISRGGSAVVALEGRVVVPIADGGVLEVGGVADLAVLPPDSAVALALADAVAVAVAVVRRGRLIDGWLDGIDDHDAGRHNDV